MIADLVLRTPGNTDKGALDWRDRVEAYADLIGGKTTGQISILEVGVFTGLLTEKLHERLTGRIARYVGVDPYIGDETDPYFNGYWQGKKSVAEATYETTKTLCDRLGVQLIREMSAPYFKRTNDLFDVVIIDGDHREEPALADLKAGWPRVKPGGILLCDDYANPDHPGVTRAADRFDHEVKPAERGCVFTFFHKPPKRNLPYPLGVAWWKKG